MVNGRVVFVVKVKTRNMYADIFQGLRNMLGMNLTSYEKMIATTIKEALVELYEENPTVDPSSIRIASSNVVAGAGAAEIIVSGVVYD
jgi:uncharacterized protein YbjQ (UPF0145 family)